VTIGYEYRESSAANGIHAISTVILRSGMRKHDGRGTFSMKLAYL